MLKIKNLSCKTEGRLILGTISLEIKPGELSLLMGPNGSGKSTLARTIMGFSEYNVISGSISLNGKDISSLSPDKRSHLGLFLAYQQPVEIPGVKLSNFLRLALNSNLPKSKHVSTGDFYKLLETTCKDLDIPLNLIDRDINTNLSGGEKKKMEILQMAILKPKYAILDEIDSGLDIDANRNIYLKIKKIAIQNNMGVLIITHYEKILEQIDPDSVYIIKNGKITESGSKKLAERISKHGYKTN